MLSLSDAGYVETESAGITKSTTQRPTPSTSVTGGSTHSAQANDAGASVAATIEVHCPHVYCLRGMNSVTRTCLLATVSNGPHTHSQSLLHYACCIFQVHHIKWE